MTEKNTLSIYGSHDASVTFIDNKNQLRIYEYERYVKKRYAFFSSEFDNRYNMGSNNTERSNFLKLIKKNILNVDIKNILYAQLNNEDKNLLLSFFPNAKFIESNHHYSHASSGFYPSNFEESLVFSIDGGGLDNNSISTTKVYHAKNNILKNITCENIDFGNPYSGIGYLISEIKAGAEGIECKNSLVYAGKIMGLCAYGEVNESWIEPFECYYRNNDLEALCNKLNIPFKAKCVSGKTSYDLAATSQYVFEKLMDKFILPFIEEYNTNVVLVGGCALNVLYNQKLYEKLKDNNIHIYVPPNPNDCGLSYGMFIEKFPNLKNEEIIYNGIEILDKEELNKFNNEFNYQEFTYTKLVKILKEGKIIGIIKGNSEVGPRALGNRSIICDPSFPDMKTILNSKVKFREWYRPFAPVCRLEDKDEYFINAKESKYMSYAPKVKQQDCKQ